MIKSLKDARIVDGLPRILAKQPWVRALSDAMGVVHEMTMAFADHSQIYTDIDNVTEDVLDALAVNWKIDWYDTGYNIEQKRRIIKTALTVRRTMGTVAAVKAQADPFTPAPHWRNGLSGAANPEHSGSMWIFPKRMCSTPLSYSPMRRSKDGLLPQSDSAPNWKA